MKTKSTKLIPGELYSDIENTDSDFVTILRFVKTEGKVDSFEYVSGAQLYFTNDDGLIKFPHGCVFFPFTEKK
jgi:hypothetical protein